MTDSITSQAMHLATTELKEREVRIAELEEALRNLCDETEYQLYDSFPTPNRLREQCGWSRSVLNKETNRG